MASDTDIADLNTKLDNLAGQVQVLTARLANAPSGQCSADLPHIGKMSFRRGPNTYHCECGQVYHKDGHGGLRE